MSLLARELEANGIITLIIGSAIDIVEQCGVPRYLHSDFPLGNPCGVPYDSDMQLKIIQQGLALIEKAEQARTTERTPFSWKDDAWREDYAKIDDSNREALRLRGERRRQQQRDDRAAGKSRAAMISDT
ncbi:MAG: hypothetical protein WDZ52_05745 [Pseudohongiellaceae bacterium]